MSITLSRSRSAIALVALCLVAGSAFAATAAPAGFDAQLLSIQQQWAHVNYELKDGDARDAAFEQLKDQAAGFAKDNPARAEALIWKGIVESSYAGAKGGLGALGLAKDARASLEASIKLDPKALDGSAYTSLGTLYSKVPGFPVGFGDDDKAEKLLKRALEFNPQGIDPNYFYAEFLLDQGRGNEALVYLDRAAGAPDRPGRETADRGRRAEIAALKSRLTAKAAH
jgi:tetratricopeptide (TPR) repeat protein